MSGRWSESWVVRSCGAGLVAGAASVAVGWTRYLQLPGAAERIDWSVVGPWVVLFGFVCALLGALGFGGGMRLASRRDGPRTSALRLAAGASLGAVLLGTVPAMAGIGGFAHLDAPFMGVQNILLAGLVASATFVAVFAPLLHPERSLSLPRRLGLAALASIITGATLGGLAWLLLQTLGLVPSFGQIYGAAMRLGVWTLSALTGAGLMAALGVFVGLATWIYLSLVLALRRRG